MPRDWSAKDLVEDAEWEATKRQKKDTGLITVDAAWLAEVLERRPTRTMGQAWGLNVGARWFIGVARFVRDDGDDGNDGDECAEECAEECAGWGEDRGRSR